MDTKHPLIATRLTKIGDWNNWKRLWKGAPFLEQRLGLLHVAFDVEVCREDWRDRKLFLLRLADGHDSPEFQWEAEIRRHVPETAELMGRCLKESAEAMKKVAAKAYQVLCDRVFDLSDRHGCTVDVVERLSDAEIFSTVLWFFCDHDRRRFGRNLPGDDKHHRDAAARKFVLELIKEGWSLDKWWEPGTQAYVETRRQFVRLLGDLGELHFLYGEIRRSDEIAVEELRRLALEEDGVQKYRTTAEAIGTYAGRSLLIVETALAEAERKARIAEAARRARVAQEDLEAAQKV